MESIHRLNVVDMFGSAVSVQGGRFHGYRTLRRSLQTVVSAPFHGTLVTRFAQARQR